MSTKLDLEVYSKLLEPDFNLEVFDLESISSFVIEVSDLADKRQEILGRLALAARKKYGKGATRHLANQAEIPLFTLRSYMNVMEKLEGLELPEDISWSFRKALAFSGNPKKYLQLVLDEGWNRLDLLKHLDKLDQKPKVKHCSQGHEFNANVCPLCNEVVK